MEKSSFKFICVCCLCLFCLNVNSQVFEDANGKPILERKYTGVQGSPYLSETWIKGEVKLTNGDTYKDIDLKYDLLVGELFFKNAQNEMMSFVIPVKEFKLSRQGDNEVKSMFFRNGYKPADGGTLQTFYQVLSDGETALLKRLAKRVAEVKPYGSATTIKTIEEVQSYYIIKNGLPVKVKKDKKTMLAMLGDYNSELLAFIKENKLTLKAETDLVSVMNYYNSLK